MSARGGSRGSWTVSAGPESASYSRLTREHARFWAACRRTSRCLPRSGIWTWPRSSPRLACSSPTRAACRRRRIGTAFRALRRDRLPSGRTRSSSARTSSSTTIRTSSRPQSHPHGCPRSGRRSTETGTPRNGSQLALPTVAEGANYDVAVVGAGYVGVPLAATFAEAGCPVLLVDVLEDVVAAATPREPHIPHVPRHPLPPP